MKILNQDPPNITLIKAKLKVEPLTIFTYGDTIYNPSGSLLQQDIIAHETIHSIEQVNDPEAWWERYILDVKFRLDQEVMAYQVQWKQIQKMPYKNKFLELHRIALDLCGPMYGNIITYPQAIKKIKNRQ